MSTDTENMIGRQATIEIQRADARSQSGDLMLTIAVEVVATKRVFGQERVAIRPLGKTRGGQSAGGTQWVLPDRLKFDD